MKTNNSVDDAFAQWSLLGLSKTALYFLSNWGMFTVAKCGVIFHDTKYELKPCVCAVCAITVASSGDITVSEPKATAGWGFITQGLHHLVHYSLLSIKEIQAAHLIQVSCGTGGPTSFPGLFLTCYLFWRNYFFLPQNSCSMLPLTWIPLHITPVLVSCDS